MGRQRVYSSARAAHAAALSHTRYLLDVFELTRVCSPTSRFSRFQFIISLSMSPHTRQR